MRMLGPAKLSVMSRMLPEQITAMGSMELSIAKPLGKGGGSISHRGKVTLGLVQ
jgi:hypothetical protein